MPAQPDIPAKAGSHGSGWSFELPDSLRLIDYERDKEDWWKGGK
jgi:hypothetical protein